MGFYQVWTREAKSAVFNKKIIKLSCQFLNVISAEEILKDQENHIFKKKVSYYVPLA